MSTPNSIKMATAHWSARVAIRVPSESERNLAAAATRRLETTDAVSNASVEAICGLKPTLSATIVTVRVALRTAEACTQTTLESALEGTPGAEQVQTVALAES